MVISFCSATRHSPPGALFETMGVTNETQESGVRIQETGGNGIGDRASSTSSGQVFSSQDPVGKGIESGEKSYRA